MVDPRVQHVFFPKPERRKGRRKCGSQSSEDSFNIKTGIQSSNAKSIFNYLIKNKVVSLVAVSGADLINGMMYGWSVVLPKLQEDTSRFTVTEDDVSWLVSVVLIMGFITAPLAGPMAECGGPRRLLMIITLPVAGLWLVQAYSPYLWLLYLARALMAICSTVVYTVMNPLAAELFPAHIRGVATALPEVFLCAGLMLSYLLASVLPWDTATAVSAAPFLLLSVMMLLVPESPYWLVRKNKIDAAERSLRLLLGRDGNVAKELEVIMSTTALKQREIKDQLRELKKKQNAFPVLLLLSIFILRELGGKGPVFYYTVYMFRKAGVQMNAFYCTVFIGIGRLASTCVSACILDVLGRRPLLVATALICAVSEGVAGAFLILEVEGTEWVPLASVIVFVISYGIGLGPIPCAYLGELLPTPVRSLGASLIIFAYSVTLFTISLVFLKEISYLGLGLTLLLYGGANLAIVPLVLLFIPETKGRTLQDLEKAFTSTKKNVQAQGNPAFEIDIMNSVERRPLLVDPVAWCYWIHTNTISFKGLHLLDISVLDWPSEVQHSKWNTRDNVLTGSECELKTGSSSGTNSDHQKQGVGQQLQEIWESEFTPRSHRAQVNASRPPPHSHLGFARTRGCVNRLIYLRSDVTKVDSRKTDTGKTELV
ncbi:facilitated trehalose transporter Tret1-like [Penaeus chinensis]|uniref:facilitated trehalose transporter Tret1-like n=1 Tax=Penaeus chinensis TaxID=139456 RepID=UPI001FB70193|nr:facilitated trehalose transporter Tret1-like [Penaeus chinensis]